MNKRKYTLRRRAAQQDETRQRIVEAAMALHEEIGPRNTTISAIAERAGVQRLTVYRHFADEVALFRACTLCWLERHPLPPLPERQASGAASPAERTRQGLQALYAYYGSTRRMWEVSHRDVELVPALQGPMGEVAAHLEAYRDALAAHWQAPPARAAWLRATLAVAVQFGTWATLAQAGLTDEAMAELAALWAAGTVLAPAAGASGGTRAAVRGLTPRSSRRPRAARLR